MTATLMFVWIIAGYFGDRLAPLSFDPVNGWAFAFLASIALDLLRIHATERPR